MTAENIKMSTKISNHGQSGEETVKPPSQRSPKVEYNQPQFSLYELPIATLSIGTKLYRIPSLYLQEYPLLEDRQLPGVPEDIGHTLVHFLYTGAYETIESPLSERTSYVEREYQRSVQVYHTCRKYGLQDLEVLAEKYIEYFGKAMTTIELMSSTREAFLLLPEDEIWLPSYVKKTLRREFAPERSQPNIHDIANYGTGKKSERFSTAVMAAVIDILYIRVQQCLKNHKGHLDSLEVEDGTEPEHVAASDAGTGEYVVWPEEPASAEADVVANGLHVTLDEHAVDEYPGSFAEATIFHPDNLNESLKEYAEQSPDRPSDDFVEYPAKCLAGGLAPSSTWQTAAFPANNAHMAGWTGIPDKPFARGPCYEEAAPNEEPVYEKVAANEPVLEEDTVPDEATSREPVAEEITNQVPLDSPLVPHSSLYANWKGLSALDKKKRAKKLRARNLPVPDKNGTISIDLA